jgi:gamma-glutamyltranspeptidase/glutathione hydrolase
VLSRYGTMKPSQVLGPAIELAETGFPVTRLQHALASQNQKQLARGSASRLFLDESGAAHSAGINFRQPALGRTLRRLSRNGFEDFYLGEIACEICADIEANGGFVEPSDLARALLVEERAPLSTTFWGDDVLTLGPPGGGLALLQMLRMASFVDPDELDMGSGDGAARVAAIISRARQDRRRYRLLTDADGVGGAAELLEDGYARSAVEAALRHESVPSGVVASGSRESCGETTHVSVMDASGNVVALTQSIERSFGACVATPSLGFLYNGYMRAFKVQNRKHPHYLRPGAPARSNAAPTIVLRDRAPRICIGSTGSERMASGIFEVLLRLRTSTPFDAVHAPRLHCTPEQHVLWEEERFPKGFRDTLLRQGFTVEAMEPYSFKMGGLQLVVRQDGHYVGVAEPRRDGAAGSPRYLAHR